MTSRLENGPKPRRGIAEKVVNKQICFTLNWSTLAHALLQKDVDQPTSEIMQKTEKRMISHEFNVMN